MARPACIVLNGPSGSGKSTIAAGLQRVWQRPLQVTGLDTFLAAQNDRFFSIDGSIVDGFNWVPTVIEDRAAYEIRPGPLGLRLIRASNAYWAATVRAGLDQVIDDVWLVPEQPEWLAASLRDAAVLWAGVHCPLDVLEEREANRGDRPIGAVRGHHALVHTFRSYDLDLDSALLSPEQCVQAILDTAPVRACHEGQVRGDLRPTCR